jgi:hypothetical protein
MLKENFEKEKTSNKMRSAYGNRRDKGGNSHDFTRNVTKRLRIVPSPLRNQRVLAALIMHPVILLESEIVLVIKVGLKSEIPQQYSRIDTIHRYV